MVGGLNCKNSNISNIFFTETHNLRPAYVKANSTIEKYHRKKELKNLKD